MAGLHVVAERGMGASEMSGVCEIPKYVLVVHCGDGA
jgi:hypothetical protein